MSRGSIFSFDNVLEVKCIMWSLILLPVG